MEKFIVLGIALVGLAVAALAGPAAADVLILDSSVAGLKRGTQLPDGARLKVPAGKSVMIMRPSGETQDVAGPYDRLVRDISRGETMSETFQRMKSQLEKESGGGAIGATRGVNR
jgi:hypothetical protein